MINDGIQSIVHPEYYIKSGNGPAIVRNIFENVEYDDYENKQLDALLDKIKEKGLKIKLKKSILLKMLMAAQYDIEKSIVNCQFHLRFLKEYHKMEYSKELSRGNVYVCGFDNQYRPIICYFLETVRRQLLIDYYVENWTIIIDLELDLPVLELDDLLQLQLHFYGNLNKILIVNGPDDIETIIIQFTDKFPDLISKLKIINELIELQRFIPKDQLEIKYGGDQTNIDQFWPLIKREGNLAIQNKPSHLSINSLISSSVNKKSSFMKITVLEENGNPLMNQQLEVYGDQIRQSSESSNQSFPPVIQEFEERSKSMSSTTKKQFAEQDVILKMEENDSQDKPIQKQIVTQQSKKQREITKTSSYSQKQTLLEGEKEIPSSYSSCCSRSCQIF